THDVYTGIALFNGKLMYIDTCTACTHVTFESMSEDEIDWYLDTGDWHGAAGGYRIQGLASCFIKKIEGTNSAVVGLPIFELYDMLKKQGYSLID
ncbi:MAG: Maf family protein, partial [Treponema sp.]|nr:Maf family protein [Treponema sp.]